MDFSENKSYIMGVLNVTPDSFSDGGLYFDNVEVAVSHAKQMVQEGADIIDVGGESSRPGSDPVSEDEELRRVLPVIKRLAKELAVPISIDTYKVNVAEACINSGASLINDISGISDPAMAELAAKYDAPIIIMHMQGQPKDMQKNPEYKDVVKEICQFFQERIEVAKKAGVKKIIVDPGIGFGKTLEHNLAIMAHVAEFKKLGYPVLVGPSRKSFISQITGVAKEERLAGTIAALVACRLQGADIFRVHDVKGCKQALQIADAIKNQV